jgi:uncharacterized membrane protein
MSDLLVVAFNSESAATVARNALVTLQQAAGTEPEDIILVMQTKAGEITLEQSIWLATGMPLGGGRWGMLIGSLFLDDRKPSKQTKKGLTALFHKAGLDAAYLQDVSRSLESGGAAVGMRVRKLGAKAVIDRLASLPETGHVMHRALSASVESELEAMLDLIPEYVPRHLREAL